MITQDRLNDLTAEINQVLTKMGFFTQMPRYRYCQVREDHYAFAWTTERVSSNKKFYALKYRITRKAWKLIHKVGFGKRRVAKARALKWYSERKVELQEKTAVQKAGELTKIMEVK